GSKTPNIIIPEFLYLGDAKTARWFPHLLSNKITHVINLSDNEIVPLRYLKIDITDDPSSNISKHFHECIDFIENAKSTNGRVYVHCLAGISRSTSIVIAYLMNSQKIHYNQAFNLVKEKRPNVKPNQGFVEQLRKFE
ncbi:crystal Structrue of A mitogen-activated protein kinase Phosphatase, Skrp1, partial [Rhizophagus irregularis]